MRGKLGALLGFVVLVGAAVGVMVFLHYNDSTRKAEKRVAALIEASRSGDPELALRQLDEAMRGEDWGTVSTATKGQLGAAVVRLLVGYVKDPFAAPQLDAASRVVTRYKALPGPAQEGAARDELLAALARWETAAGADRETKIAILRLEMLVADYARTADIGQRLAQERFELAKAIAKEWPVDALALLSEEPRYTQSVALAGEILATLVDHPSLLVEAGRDVDAWLASVSNDHPLRAKVESQRALGREAQKQTAELPADKLAALHAERPWDQWLVVRQANADLDAGKADAAAAKLRALGAPGLTIRDATFLLGRIAMMEGQLDVADQLLSGLLHARLSQFLAATAAFQAAFTALQDRLTTKLKLGTLPPDLIAKLEKAPEAEQQQLLNAWMTAEMEADPEIAKRRDAMMSYGEVVPASLLAGMVKLRRAQALAGADRDAMLAAAERTFLAVRTAAEGQPEFHLGLGEIYARLGKTKESDAELQGLLDRRDPALALRVAMLYREIGGLARATEIATQLYEAATTPEPQKKEAAIMLALLADGDEAAETWYRRADPASPMVKSALLELEGRRLRREGKRAECDQRFAEAAKLSLAQASVQNTSAFNNAALAHQQRFSCTGDLAVLKEAERSLEQAYRAGSDAPIVVVNLAALLRANAVIRVLAKRVDARALTGDDAWTLFDALVDGPERATLLAELVADPGWRRSSELYAQHLVLAPSATTSYRELMRSAERLRDEKVAAATLEQLRAAKRLDTSDVDQQLRRYRAGELDRPLLQETEAQLQHHAALLATELEPHTRAAVLYLQSRAQVRRALMSGSLGELAAARDAAVQAAKLWPALPVAHGNAYIAIDMAGASADAKRWQQLRRERSAGAVIADLVRDNDPLAAKVRAAPAWADVAASLRGVTSRPDVDDLRLARLLDDPAITAWAQAATSDRVLRLELEANKLLMPTEQKRLDEDLAALGPP